MLKELRDGKLVEPSQEILEMLQAAKSIKAAATDIAVALTNKDCGVNPAYSATEREQIANVRVRFDQIIAEPKTRH